MTNNGSHSDPVSSRHTVTPEVPSPDEIERVDAGIIERIDAIAPVIRQHQTETEEIRALPDAGYHALRSTGAFHIAIPRSYGGYETSITSQLRVSAAVAAIDGSAGWVTALSNVAAWGMCIFGRQARDEVFGDPECSVCGVLAPAGFATPVEGGYRVSGKWFYASSSAHARWANLAVQLKDEKGAVVDIASVLMPRADYRIEDTWFTSGMRGTSSNTIVADNAFVPGYRVTSLRRAIAGDYIADYPDHPLYRAALGPALLVVLMGPQLGLGKAALDYVIANAGTKSISYTQYARQADSVAFQLQVARAAAKIDTAHLHAYRAAADIDDAARRGIDLNAFTRARTRADCAVALESINEALNTLMFAHGAGGFASANPLQRIWRDSNIAARHAVTLPDLNFEIYGKVLLGLENKVIELTAAF